MSMGSRGERNNDDQWSQIVADEAHNVDQNTRNLQKQPQIAVTYQRRTPEHNHPDKEGFFSNYGSSKACSSSSGTNNESRVGLVASAKQVSWSRSLSTRGRVSIAAAVYVDYGPQQQGPRRRQKPAIPKVPKGKKFLKPPSFEKECEYFKEIDAFELLEESPSPKKSAWVSGNPTDAVAIPSLCTRLEKWLRAKKSDNIPSSSLSHILRTPANALAPIPCDGLAALYNTTSSELQLQTLLELASVHNVDRIPQGSVDSTSVDDKEFEDLVSEIRKLSLTSPFPSPRVEPLDPFSRLLQECGQSSPCTLLDVFSNFCDPGQIVKIGEGTYGEAFIAGGCVCKIVPIDGDLRVNGEMQKRSAELLEEVVLSRTLNCLRRHGSDIDNATTTFVETKDLRVCQGRYDPSLIRAWEAWDEKNDSENDHPQQFPEKQRYVVFVLEHGGTDLESFVLLDFNEARSLVTQVTTALAVAEAEYEFEHRDLHWGNILLSRKEVATLQLTLEGKSMLVKTNGLLVSIIDFTLSRMKAGDTILYLDLSSDPELFEGERGNKQAETYRKMREVTDDQWEGSFPRTNVLWLQYLVDMLLIKKSYKRTGKDERDLRSLKKRLNSYNSAREAVHDPFFGDSLLPLSV
ncbi:hypothetical protein Dimus_012032 [Dionaea muscipula]